MSPGLFKFIVDFMAHVTAQSHPYHQHWVQQQQADVFSKQAPMMLPAKRQTNKTRKENRWRKSNVLQAKDPDVFLRS